MGRKELQQIARLQEEMLPDLGADLENYTGSSMFYAVDWESLQESAAISRLEDALSTIGRGVRAAVADAATKAAFAQQIKRIAVKNVGAASDKSISRDGDTLRLQLALGGKDSSGHITADEVQAFIIAHFSPSKS